MQMLDKLAAIAGAAHVLTGEDMARYSADWTENYHWTPLAVVRPRSTAEVSAILKLAHDTDTPVVPVAGNTGLNGGTAAQGALMLSLERMNTIREIRPDARVAVVEAGVILSQLHDACDAVGLIFPLYFGARGSAMIGGVLSTNAGGSNVLRYGSTRALCLGLEVVLADGRVMNLMTELHKDNAGYDLKDLMIGAEGTLGIITGAVMKLHPKPSAYATAMVAAPDLDAALVLLNRLQGATGGMVEAFEYMPRLYMETLKAKFPETREPFEGLHEINILVEVASTQPAMTQPTDAGSIPLVSALEDALAEMLDSGLALDAAVAQNEGQRREMWDRRERAGEVLLMTKPLVNHDVSVPVDKVSTFLRRMEQRLAEIDPGARDCTVSHLGDGNVHYAVWPSTHDPAQHVAITEAVEDVTLSLGGSFSAEHGIGLSKLGSMARRKDPVALAMMHAIKAAFDPKGLLNPGKVLPPQA